MNTFLPTDHHSMKVLGKKQGQFKGRSARSLDPIGVPPCLAYLHSRWLGGHHESKSIFQLFRVSDYLTCSIKCETEVYQKWCRGRGAPWANVPDLILLKLLRWVALVLTWLAVECSGEVHGGASWTWEAQRRANSSLQLMPQWLTGPGATGQAFLQRIKEALRDL